MTDEGTLYCDNLLCEGSQSTTEINMQTVYRLQQLCQGRTLAKHREAKQNVIEI